MKIGTLKLKIRKTFLFFLFLYITISIYIFKNFYFNHLLNENLKHEEENLTISLNNIKEYLYAHIQDINFLASIIEIDYNKSNTLNEKSTVEYLNKSLATKGNFQQLRILDLKGKEVSRIDII
ncbi:MAG: hypothetical protein KDK36_17885, partial [Leptospiraceae bacterium]|nr:hypothetical protein [Leptospiraceae bacterium]